MYVSTDFAIGDRIVAITITRQIKKSIEISTYYLHLSLALRFLEYSFFFYLNRTFVSSTLFYGFTVFISINIIVAVMLDIILFQVIIPCF